MQGKIEKFLHRLFMITVFTQPRPKLDIGQRKNRTATTPGSARLAKSPQIRGFQHLTYQTAGIPPVK